MPGMCSDVDDANRSGLGPSIEQINQRKLELDDADTLVFTAFDAPAYEETYADAPAVAVVETQYDESELIVSAFQMPTYDYVDDPTLV
jgi:hypothetical protein